MSRAAQTIASGVSCTQGLRRRPSMMIDAVTIIAPPKVGQLVVLGPGFFYRAPEFRGEDSFTLEITGSDNRLPGNSTIRITVSVR